jgi:hypothetical protein
MKIQEEHLFSTYEHAGGTHVLYIWTLGGTYVLYIWTLGGTYVLHMNITGTYVFYIWTSKRNTCSLHMNI